MTTYGENTVNAFSEAEDIVAFSIAIIDISREDGDVPKYHRDSFLGFIEQLEHIAWD